MRKYVSVFSLFCVLRKTTNFWAIVVNLFFDYWQEIKKFVLEREERRKNWLESKNIFYFKPLMIAMMMNCFFGMVHWQKAFSLIFTRGHCQRSSPSRIYDMLRAGFEPAQNLNSGLVEWSCAELTTITPWKTLAKPKQKNV